MEIDMVDAHTSNPFPLDLIAATLQSNNNEIVPKGHTSDESLRI